MSYKLLIKKIWIEGKRIISREEIRGYCNSLKLPYESAIGYLLSNDYLVRILRGIFYVKTIEERKNDNVAISFYDAVSEAMKVKKIENWYFGLESAIKLNNLTHEYFAVDFIISDRLKRPRPIEILGHKVRFLKIKKELFGFGIKKGRIPYSNIEKTVLDIAYFGIYNSLSETEIRNKIVDYLEKCGNSRINEYAKHYPKTVLKLIKKAGK